MTCPIHYAVSPSILFCFFFARQSRVLATVGAIAVCPSIRLSQFVIASRDSGDPDSRSFHLHVARGLQFAGHRYRITRTERVNPLTAIIKPQSSGQLYNNTLIGTVAVDGWSVAFGTARRGLSGLRWVAVWRGGLVVGRRTCDLGVAGSRPGLGRDAAAQQP